MRLWMHAIVCYFIYLLLVFIDGLSLDLPFPHIKYRTRSNTKSNDALRCSHFFFILVAHTLWTLHWLPNLGSSSGFHWDGFVIVLFVCVCVEHCMRCSVLVYSSIPLGFVLFKCISHSKPLRSPAHPQFKW